MRELFVMCFLVLTGCGGRITTSSPQRAGKATGRPGVVLVGGARLRIVFRGERLEGSRERIDAWVRRSAEMVVDYCGGEFPVPDLRIEILVRRHGGVGFGQHFGGRRLRIRIGSDVGDDTLLRDWVMVHEMLHTALPVLPRQHRWMQEGLSTYLESVTRSRAGYTSEESVWQRWVGSMEVGQPAAGDRGLDRTPTWGRIYWGGALFWLTVDVELRRRSDGRVGLEHAIRGILARGGNSRARWPSAAVVAAGDDVTSMRVLSELYEEQAVAGARVDLEGLWRDLGVRRSPSGDVTLDDEAPLSSVRRAIAAPR